MSTITLEEEIAALVKTLNDDQKRQLLNYGKEIKRPQGEPGWKLIEAARRANFDKESVAEMEAAINEAFESQDVPYPEVNFDDED